MRSKAPLVLMEQAVMVLVFALAAADAAIPYERLPLVQDAHLMDAILYSGVWCRFRIKESDSSKEVTQHV